MDAQLLKPQSKYLKIDRIVFCIQVHHNNSNVYKRLYQIFSLPLYNFCVQHSCEYDAIILFKILLLLINLYSSLSTMSGQNHAQLSTDRASNVVLTRAGAYQLCSSFYQPVSGYQNSKVTWAN